MTERQHSALPGGLASKTSTLREAGCPTCGGRTFGMPMREEYVDAGFVLCRPAKCVTCGTIVETPCRIWMAGLAVIVGLFLVIPVGLIDYAFPAIANLIASHRPGLSLFKLLVGIVSIVFGIDVSRRAISGLLYAIEFRRSRLLRRLEFESSAPIRGPNQA